MHRPSSSQVPETSCNRPRASIGTEGHALDPRITPSRMACAVWEITGFKVGAVAVVAASAMTAAKAAVLITVRMGHVRLGAAPSRSVGLNSTQFAMRFLLFWGDGGNFPSEPPLGDQTRREPLHGARGDAAGASFHSGGALPNATSRALRSPDQSAFQGNPYSNLELCSITPSTCLGRPQSLGRRRANRYRGVQSSLRSCNGKSAALDRPQQPEAPSSNRAPAGHTRPSRSASP